MDDLQGRRCRKWTVLKMGGLESGRSRKWTVSKVDGLRSERSLKWMFSKIGHLAKSALLVFVLFDITRLFHIMFDQYVIKCPRMTELDLEFGISFYLPS